MRTCLRCGAAMQENCDLKVEGAGYGLVLSNDAGKLFGGRSTCRNRAGSNKTEEKAHPKQAAVGQPPAVVFACVQQQKTTDGC